jgi:hypothetical protein
MAALTPRLALAPRGGSGGFLLDYSALLAAGGDGSLAAFYVGTIPSGADDDDARGRVDALDKQRDLALEVERLRPLERDCLGGCSLRGRAQRSCEVAGGRVRIDVDDDAGSVLIAAEGRGDCAAPQLRRPAHAGGSPSRKPFLNLRGISFR